ncbi:MAG: hypothetical protein BEU04_03050 [Marine Group III euryarchaeote CG-Bathy1]|uniref:Cation efflux protein transmembrane domain-containing protein n=1 Tax=Marine Group III euryarchaeote CG-Bathy1 TaxID=1889001 RepID=A0A1J5T0X2_9ARCH|nr:MAG: hypothetical protein BEU04_03050 [Marine Group III euryarchaeote CG-Bathy1]
MHQPLQSNHTHENDGEKRTKIVVIITLVMMVIEIGTGVVYNSIALLADGLHMGTHAAALGITLYAYYFARTNSDIKDNPEKTEQVNALGGFASAIVLFIVALYIGWEALMRLSSPEPIGYEEAILVAIVGLVVNLYCAHILGDGHHHGHTHHEHHTHEFNSEKEGIVGEYLEDFNQVLNTFGGWLTDSKNIDDLNLRGAYLHVLSDALISIFVIFALLMGMMFGLEMLDPIVGMIGGIVIAKWSVGLIKDSSKVLLEME